MNLKTAALRLGVHYQTAYRWVRSGQLVAVKVGAGYEISDAAVARLQAQRAATGRMPEGARPALQYRALDAASSVEEALHVLDLMVDAVTLDSTAVGERAARVVAEHLGDTAFVYRRSADDGMVVVYAAHRDPVSEVAASTLGRDPRTSTNLVRRVVTTGELICVAQVPQRELRRRLHPELHEHLQLSGCYSAMCAPVGATGALLVTRDLPGRPYARDDVALVESIAARVARADERARCWTAAWEVRRALVAALSSLSLDVAGFDALVESMSSGDRDAFAGDVLVRESVVRESVVRESVVPEPVVAVLDLELRHVACSKAYAALVGEDATWLTGAPLRSIVRDGGALDEALAPVLLGEIDFRSVELEVLTDQVRVALHIAMVRDDDVTPRSVVVVAHAVPALSSG
ncbi:MAG TPA: GAF domain-containing protein [Acidimicrobiia bacterium]